ncbi:hypothetical protein CGRA01v4_02642 [Colletotrichum graminicola]|nr:hypothetical protein CGRA01v4_02642 [Colletotrichum graminicola]
MISIKIYLSKARSLSNLATRLALHSGNEQVLVGFVGTVSSAPPSVNDRFITLDPATIEAEKEQDSALAQWAALDALLAWLSRLHPIIAMVVFESCIGMFMGPHGSYAKAILTVCDFMFGLWR